MTDILAIYVYYFVLISSIIAFSGLINGLNKNSTLGIIIMLLSIIFLLILRDPLAPDDAENYISMYNQQSSFYNVFNTYHGNVFFSFTQYIGNIIGLSAEKFIITQTLFFCLLTFVGLRLIFQSNKMLLMSLSFFVLTSTFILLFTNVIRQGLALSLILLATGLFIRNYRFSAYFTLLLAIFSHFSALAILGIILLVRNVRIKNKYILLMILMLPFVPIVSHFFILDLALIGGLFEKIESFANINYSNTLVYAKILILYFSLIIFYLMGIYNFAFEDGIYFFIFKLYLLIMFLLMFTLPVLLLSSRYIYYASALLPILYTFVLFRQSNIISINVRFGAGLVTSIIVGSFVFSFDSTRMQLGI